MTKAESYKELGALTKEKGRWAESMDTCLETCAFMRFQMMGL